METIQEVDPNQELKVTFYPELFLQRRIWILNILREENITKVCYLFYLNNYIHRSSHIDTVKGSRCRMW